MIFNYIYSYDFFQILMATTDQFNSKLGIFNHLEIGTEYFPNFISIVRSNLKLTEFKCLTIGLDWGPIEVNKVKLQILLGRTHRDP